MEAVSGQEHGHLCPVIEGINAGAMGFHPYRINAGIGSAPSGQILERLADIDFLVVEDGGLVLCTRHLEPLWNAINSDDVLSAEHVGTANRKLPDRSTAPDGDGITPLDVAVLGSHVTGGKDIGQKQDLLVAEAGRYFHRAHVGKGHADVFCLSAGIAAIHMGVAKKSRTRIAIGFLRHPGVWVRVVAERPQLPLTEKTLATGNGKRHHDPVAGAEVRHGAANLNHLTHAFVSEDVPFVHGGNIPIVEMHIRAANSAQCDLDDGVPWIEDLRLRYRFNTDIAFAIPADCFHLASPPIPPQWDSHKSYLSLSAGGHRCATSRVSSSV